MVSWKCVWFGLELAPCPEYWMYQHRSFDERRWNIILKLGGSLSGAVDVPAVGAGYTGSCGRPSGNFGFALVSWKGLLHPFT